MLFTIDKNNNLFLNKKPDYSYYGETSFFVYGELLGIFYKEKFFSKKEAEKIMLENFITKRDITRIIEGILGNCIIIIQNKELNIKIFNTIDGGNIFYSIFENKFYFTKSEFEISSLLKNNKISELEIITLIQQHFNRRNSFRSIFEGSKILPTGFYLNIDRNFYYETNTYLNIEDFNNENINLKNVDHKFKEIFENSIKFHIEKFKPKKIYSHLSGGIDSATTSIAIKNLNLNSKCLHHSKLKDLQEDIHILSTKIGLPLEVIFGMYGESKEKWWNEYNQDCEFIKRYIGCNPLDNIFFTKFYRQNNILSLGGCSLGQNYQIFPSIKPFFNMNKIIRTIFYFRNGIFYRILCTKFFIRFMGNKFFNLFISFFVSKKFQIPKNQFEYLSFLAIDAVRPFIEKNFLGSLKKFYAKKYYDFYSNLYLKEILNNEDYMKLKKNINLPINKIQNYARLISFSRGVSNQKNEFKCYEDYLKLKLLEPGWMAPVNNFLLRLPISTYSVLFPKELYLRYFKNELNWDYHNDFIKKTLKEKNFVIQIFNFLKSIHKKYIKKEQNIKLYDNEIINSAEFKLRYSKYYEINDSILLKKITNKELHSFIRNLFQNIKSGKGIDLLKAIQVINLEAFLREVFGKNGEINL